MSQSLFFTLLKVLIFGIILIIIENLLATYIHPLLDSADLISCFLILILIYLDETYTKWLFIVAFILGLIEASWLLQRLGILSLYYMFLTLPYLFYRNISNGNLQLFLLILGAILFKFVIMFILSYIFNDSKILYFLFSMGSVYHIISTILIMVIIGLPINMLIRRSRF